MSLIEVIPYDYLPFCNNLHEKRVFIFDSKIDFQMLIKVSNNLEHQDMAGLKESISNFLYKDNIKFWMNLLENNSSFSGNFERSKFLEDALLTAGSKNDY